MKNKYVLKFLGLIFAFFAGMDVAEGKWLFVAIYALVAITLNFAEPKATIK